MTTEDALLAAVIASPDDDLPRLVYCDWLEESGDPEKLARAEFIRVQCEIARIPVTVFESPNGETVRTNSIRDSKRYGELRGRERELLGRNVNTGGRGVLPQYFLWLNGIPSHMVKVRGFGLGADEPPERQSFRRGFIAEVHCTLSQWCGGPCVRCHGRGMFWANFVDGEESLPCGCERGHAPGIGPEAVRRHPVQVVRLTDAAIVPYYDTGRFAVAHPTPNLLPMSVAAAVASFFDSETDAYAALSAAFIAWAKKRNRWEDAYDLSQANATPTA